ncbi:replication initiator protein A [Enterococcus sp. DIV0240d]|uniref:replication initiator protein A n=1 Tax=Enterococcus sp. DIV0240d TaxID=2774717 RepID=UPI003F685330
MKYPIFLDKHKKYKKMKQSTKKVYMYLKKQNEYSLENSKVDSKGRIFLIFAIEKIAEKSCLTKKTVISALRELEEYKLITIKKNGFNKKTGKNNPNFYYLLKPEFSEGDFYKKKCIEENLHLPTNQHYSPSEKNTPSDKSTFDGDKSFPLPGEKFLQELNHSSKDFKDFKESQNADFIDSLSVENKKLDEILIESLIEKEWLYQVWGDNIVNCLKLVGNNDYSQFYDWYKKFKYAIKSAEKEQKIQLKIIYEICNNKYFVDYVREQLSMTLRDLIRRAKTDHRIKQKDDYIFASLKNKALELIELQISEGIDKQ